MDKCIHNGIVVRCPGCGHDICYDCGDFVMMWEDGVYTLLHEMHEVKS
jgi:hypothetical protein